MPHKPQQSGHSATPEPVACPPWTVSANCVRVREEEPWPQGMRFSLGGPGSVGPRLLFGWVLIWGILRYVGERKGAAVPMTPRRFSACLATWPIRCGSPAASSALHSPGLG